MDTHTQDHHARQPGTYGFAIGLAAGTVIGAGLAFWLAPRAAAEIGNRVADTASRFGQRASEHYHQASQAVGEAVGAVSRQAQGARTDAADAVARGAREVERVAVAVKNDRL